MSGTSAIPDLKLLEEKARGARLYTLKTIARKRKGHLGGTLSCTDLLVALYHGGVLKFDPKNPQWVDRDRFLIGKGHAHLALHYIWVDLGILDQALVDDYGKNGALLGHQLDIRVPGSEYNTGSLGHVLGIGAGIALAAKMDKKTYRTVVLVGDAECDEGSVWESVMFAGREHLNNLTVIVDRNMASLLAVRVDDDGSGRIDDKFKACGWDVKEINGHSFPEILSALDPAPREKPLAIIAHTVKGKGVPLLEKGPTWHHNVPPAAELAKVIEEFESATAR
jgi:transketolase